MDGNCVEWRKSSECSADANCVEIHKDQYLVEVRDSKNPGMHLTFTKDEWEAFIIGVKAGEFDI